MKKTLIGTMMFAVALTLPAFAAEDARPRGGPPPSVEEKKAEILKHMEERAVRHQQEKACVQAAKSHEELKACREKYAPPRGPERQGEAGGPGGSGRPDRPGRGGQGD